MLDGLNESFPDTRFTLGVLPMEEIEALARYGIKRFEINWLEAGSQNLAVAALMEGRVDAAFLRSSLLESLVRRGELDVASVSVINRQKLADYPFAVSTRLHPKWPVVATPPHRIRSHRSYSGRCFVATRGQER